MSLYRHRLAVLIIFSVAGAKGAGCEPAPRMVSVVRPRDAAAPVKTGAKVLSEALTNKGLQVKLGSESAHADLEVTVHVSNGSQPSGRVSEKPELYGIFFSSNHHSIHVDGRDATGSMYGEFDLAEQIVGAATNDWEQELKPVSRSLFLEIAGATCS